MLSRIPITPPKIFPILDLEKRPLFSIMIPSYNCIQYLPMAIESVMRQDMGPELMQIEVIDDCSTDGDIENLVRELGKGRVLFFKQDKNVGSLRNFETCLNRARGHYIHLLHGDDIVKKGFYKEIKLLFENFPDAGSAITHYNWINEKNIENQPNSPLLNHLGILDNWLLKISSKQLIQPPAVVVKRSVYEKVGGFYAVHYGEDWEMWIRIASQFKVAYSPKCLASYRGGHSTNISSAYFSSGKNIDDIIKVIEITQQYLPKHSRKRVRNAAKKNFSIYYARSAYSIKEKGLELKVARKIAVGSFRLNINFQNLYWTLCLFFDIESLRKGLIYTYKKLFCFIWLDYYYHNM